MSDENLFEELLVFNELDTDNVPILYHYCSTEAFLSVLSNRSLWLSDINTLNDYSEHHWAYDRFIEAINEEYDDLSPEFIEAVDLRIASVQLSTLPMIACFSQNGDVLSQWRAYADDGRGVSIGFDAELIKSLAVRCAPVVYDRDAQVKSFRQKLLAANMVWNNEKEKDREQFLNEFAFTESFDMCLFKNPAFSEEGEVRIIRAATVSEDNGNWSISDPGGVGNDKLSRKKQTINFRSRDGGIVSYMSLPLRSLGNKLIKEVVLGPKSLNSGIEVSMALASSGFVDTDIVKSEATYR